MGQHRKTRKKRTSPNTMPTHVIVPEESELRMPPENEIGNIEYKSQLIQPTDSRIQHLATQMKWRLTEGNGEAFYELGVLDDGLMEGLNPHDLAETMKTMYQMAKNASASLFILNERCVYGNPDEPDCRKVLEVLVKQLPSEQPFHDMRIGLLGAAGCGKSTLCGVLTQGNYDNGHGLARLNMLRYSHEVRSGKTSSITIDCFGWTKDGEILNYKDSDLKTILERSTKLCTLIDLAGDNKYLKTTIFGLSGYSPDYCTILVNARIGWTELTEEHLTIANAFGIPVFFVINKIDLAKEDRINKILNQIQVAIDRSQKRMPIKHVLNEEDCAYAANSIGNIMPVFSTSTVSGMNLNLLTRFLNLLPNRNSAGSDVDASPLFYIDEIFNHPEAGLILCGLVGAGNFNEADHIQIGPDSSGNYRLAQIKSLRRNKQPVLKIHSGETASIAVEFLTSNSTSFNIKKGMVIVSKHDFGICCKKFIAHFKLLSHFSEELGVGFQGTAFIGSLRRAVKIIDIDADSIRLDQYVNVTFEFYGGPEFVRVGNTLFFKERGTKGVGEIIEIPDS